MDADSQTRPASICIEAAFSPPPRHRAQPQARVDPHRQPTILRQLVLAHQIDQAIAEGRARNRADVARQLGVSRACVTQWMRLLRLAPAVQERILLSEPEALCHVRKQTVRAMIHESDPNQQLALLDTELHQSTQEH